MSQDAPGSRGASRLRSAWASAGRSSTEHLASEAVVAYVDGELTMTAHQRAAAHLGTCPECAAEVDGQQRARSAVRSAAPLAVPAGLQSLLCGIPQSQQRTRPQQVAQRQVPQRQVPQQQVTRERSPGRRSTPPPRRSNRGAVPLAVATVSALAVGALTMVVTSPAAGPRSAPTPRASSSPTVVGATLQSAKVPARAIGASVSATSWAGQTRTSP